MAVVGHGKKNDCEKSGLALGLFVLFKEKVVGAIFPGWLALNSSVKLMSKQEKINNVR